MRRQLEEVRGKRTRIANLPSRSGQLIIILLVNQEGRYKQRAKQVVAD